MKNAANMKKALHVAILLLVVFASRAAAQSNNDTLQFCKVRLNNGTEITGTLVQQDSLNAVVYNSGLGQITILLSNIETIETVQKGKEYTFKLSSGKTYRGTVAGQDERSVRLRTEYGDVLIMTASIVSFSSASDRLIEPFDHSSRYLFGPSAIPLRKGEGYYHNVMILMNGVQYGITDHFSMGGGIIGPIGYHVNMKYGTQVGKNTYVAVGGMGVCTVFGLDWGVGCAFGSVTYGDRQTNATLTMGYGGIKNYNGWSVTSRPIINLSGVARITDGFSLITENYLIPSDREHYNGDVTHRYLPQLSGGVRLGSGKHVFDIALTAVGNLRSGNTIVLPFFSYSCHFHSNNRK